MPTPAIGSSTRSPGIVDVLITRRSSSAGFCVGWAFFPSLPFTRSRPAHSGKTHTLHTSVAVANNGVTVWAQTDIATLTMRKLSPEFIGHYLAAAGEAVLSSVGAYQIESIGIQLFEKIDGDFFSILGLPLLPLLDTLRREGVIES